MKIRLGTIVGAIAVLCAYAAQAHHAVVSTFDVDKNTAVQGVVTRFLFRNPHVRVYFDVTNADGSTTAWVGDGSAATILRREGWTAKTLQPGDSIQVIGPSSRDGSPMVVMASVSLVNDDGSIAREIYGSVEDFSLTYDAELLKLPLTLEGNIPNLTGIWTGQGSPYAPPRGPIPTLNEAGEKVQATYNIIDDPQVFCDTPGLVRQGGMTPHGVKITQFDDRVVFEYEEYGVSYAAYFDPDSVATDVKTHLGNSVARYEDDVLVVETKNLLGEQIHADGYRLSDETRVLQTYERVDEADHSSLLKIHTVVSDPLYLESDFEFSNIKMASAPYEFIENGCVPPLRDRNSVHPAMNVFLTSVGLGAGADSAGLEGANAHCKALAASVGQGVKRWQADLSSTGSSRVDARDGSDAGPWYNAKGDVVADPEWTTTTVVTERGVRVNEGGDDGLFYCFVTEQ